MGLDNNIEYVTTCGKCGSDNVYYSRKNKCFICEDCGNRFSLDDSGQKSLRIFLSYGHDDNSFVVEEIRKILLEKGHNPWVDKYKIKGGRDWRVQITNGILDSDDFLAFITNYSTRKPGVCLDEIAIAIGARSCRIQSILLEKDAVVPSSISTKQWIDLTDWKQKYLQGEHVWKVWLDQKTDEIISIIGNPLNERKSTQIIRIFNAIRPITPEIKLKQLLSGDILSRKWLFQKVRDWYDTDSKCLFLIGGPGAGKSVLCAQLSHYMVQCVGIYFLEWNNAESRNLRIILISIIFQLSCNIDDYREMIMNELSSVSDTCSDDYVVNQLLLSPLNSLIEGDREDKFIIIDALDEFENDERNVAFILLKRLVDESPRWLRWVITCRPIADELQFFFSAKLIDIDDYSEHIQDDIRDYCKGYLKNSEKADSVVAKSNGSFIYAKELVEAINRRHINTNNLDELPISLASVFITNLRRLLKKDSYSDYKSLISILLVAQEPVEKSTIMNVLCLNDEKVVSLITRIKQFINIDNDVDGKEFISIYHKSFSDWLYSPESSIYRITKKKAHGIYSEYIVKHKDRIVNDEYISKYAYTHLRNACEWVNLDFQSKKDILLSCITAADKYGNLTYEKQYLNIYLDELGEDIPFLMSKLHYIQKTNSKGIEEVAERLICLSNDSTDEKLKFEAKVNAAIGLFYAGKDIESRELLKSMNLEYKKMDNIDDKYVAMYAHALCLPSHDFDYNEDVVNVADTSARLHNEQGYNYKYFVALVNKFDALMGCGKMYEAFTVATSVFRLNNEKYYVHIDDILQICYANLLQTAGRIMEALNYYENGIDLAKNIHKWDYLYGSIWRELAIARFGDKSCLKRLELFVESATEANYSYLASLGDCFYVMSLYLLGIDIESNIKLQTNLIKAYKNVVSYGFHGHILQVMSAACLKNWDRIIGIVIEPEDVFSIMKECQGIKGCPDVINTFIESQKNNVEGSQWKKKYLMEIMNYKESFYSNITSNLSEEPLLNIPNCYACEAKCCYDGVYLNDKEADTIEKFVSEHQERFEDLHQDFIIQGTWKGLEHLKKTAVKEHNYIDRNYPSHFSKTRCVFCNDEGLCLLQIVATDLQMHPWAIKPRACWSFPIHGVKDGIIISPPKLGEPDPNDIGPEYPGYVTCLACGRAQIKGVSWKKIYKNEIEYYNYLIKSGKLQQ